jgi:hypothetical protein
MVPLSNTVHPLRPMLMHLRQRSLPFSLPTTIAQLVVGSDCKDVGGTTGQSLGPDVIF